MKRDASVFFVSFLMIFALGIFFITGYDAEIAAYESTGAGSLLRTTLLDINLSVFVMFIVSVVLGICAVVVDKKGGRAGDR